ncbi:class I SAM-dependent methyltransferase [Flavobacterium aurantiibacter]|uniref:Uncharacterized protein n=1 Tax=Flavobacterium aurantiibacter TaxID=2023067 RepID=A0A255ZY83_9FLAO|nr:hypothetical protein [Flavobacterium aurantiibacter]OYQ46453.1 hypothetical protein CHX27_04360 [Flavobacterium aurantiibacter]
MATSENKFFEKQTLSSRIKASIVSEYFPSYCKIIVNKHTPVAVRYIDLFAGPGIYNDQNPSTPILIAKHCERDPFLKNIVKMIFNDNFYSDELKRNFEKHFNENTFKHKPHFGKGTVGENIEITKFF